MSFQIKMLEKWWDLEMEISHACCVNVLKSFGPGPPWNMKKKYIYCFLPLLNSNSLKPSFDPFKQWLMLSNMKTVLRQIPTFINLPLPRNLK